MMKKSLFLALFLCAACFARCENLLTNASFENVDEQGFPMEWKSPGSHWQGSSAAAYEGKRSLLFDNTDPSKTAWMTRAVKLEPGKTYEYSAYMKVVMKPDAPKNAEPVTAAIILEYSKDGKFAGGNYGCSKVSLNNEWIRISGRAVIPDVDHVNLELLPKPRNTVHGQIWFDCVEIHEVEGIVFAALPVTDCYRDEAAGGTVTVFAGLGAEKKALGDKALQDSTLRLLQADKLVLEVPVKEVQVDALVYEFDAGKLAPGIYTMQCRVVNPANQKVYTAENLFKRLEKKPSYRVYVDKHHRMIVDGKPFFPLGMYHKGATKENLKPYLDSDFNCLLDYVPMKKEMLDYLDQNGIKVFFFNPYASSRSNDKAKTLERHKIGYKNIEEFRSHPAVIAWYINDELPAQYVQDALEYRRGCEERDPDHPTWSVLCNSGDFLTYLPASDIHGSDPYPIPGGTIGNAYKTAKKSADATLGAKMIIQVPQAFCWGRYWKSYGYAAEKTASCPMPTFEEMDAMAWMAIAGGANGLMFYSYFDILARDKAEPGLPAIPFDKSFGDVKKIASRVKAHEEVLLSVEKPLDFKVVSNPKETVCFRAYALNGVTWLLAVNTAADKNAAFELEFAKPVTAAGVSLSETEVKTNGQKVSAALKPLQVVFMQFR